MKKKDKINIEIEKKLDRIFDNRFKKMRYFTSVKRIPKQRRFSIDLIKKKRSNK